MTDNDLRTIIASLRGEEPADKLAAMLDDRVYLEAALMKLVGLVA